MALKPSPTLALVDDHTLFRKGLINLIEMVNSNYTILFEADNGLDLQKKLDPSNQPDIILMDINMPGIDGFASVQWLKDHYPLINILVVSMIEREETIVRMLKMGVKGYLCKDVEPKELGEALHSIINKGFYYTDFITGKLVHSLQNGDPVEQKDGAEALRLMNDRERDFLQLACSEFTYNEIASKMFLSPKTIDGYRNALFEKLNVKSRVGLALYAVKHGIVHL
ncbi:MAG: response regulator transcription factor [Agriterribacter sp.]